mgnify:FL=1
MAYPLELSFKVLGFAPQIFLRDAEGNTLFYVRQKLFKFREEIEVFADADKAAHLFNINADKIIDFSARYHFSLPNDGERFGSVKRHGMRSIWR